MKNNWPVKKLGEVAEIIVGKTPGTIDYMNGGDYKVLKYRDITKNGINWSMNGKGFVKHDSLKGLKEVQIGDLLITSAGHSSEKIGEEAVVIERLLAQFKKVFFASELICYRAIPKMILPEWLLLYILSEFGQNQLKKIIGDSVHLTKEKSQKLEIPVPQIEEQKRIVKKLEKILAKIEEAHALRKEAREDIGKIVFSAINQLFLDSGEKWGKTKIDNVANVTSSKRVYESEYVESGVPFFRTKEIVELANNKEIRTELFISEKRFKELKNRFGSPKNGDVLITAIGTIGEIYVVDRSDDFYFKDGNVLWLKDINNMNPNFLKLCLQFAIDMLKEESKGSAYKALSIEKLKRIEILHPDLKEQEKIVKYLDGLSEKVQVLQNLQEKQLQELEVLKQSVLHQAFQGELAR